MRLPAPSHRATTHHICSFRVELELIGKNVVIDTGLDILDMAKDIEDLCDWVPQQLEGVDRFYSFIAIPQHLDTSEQVAPLTSLVRDDPDAKITLSKNRQRILAPAAPQKYPQATASLDSPIAELGPVNHASNRPVKISEVNEGDKGIAMITDDKLAFIHNSDNLLLQVFTPASHQATIIHAAPHHQPSPLSSSNVASPSNLDSSARPHPALSIQSSDHIASHRPWNVVQARLGLATAMLGMWRFEDDEDKRDAIVDTVMGLVLQNA